MSLYAIGDLHLSLDGKKPMDKFGPVWENHAEKLKEGFGKVQEDDLTVLCGDLSWGMSLEGAKDDFAFIHRLPGKKLLLKGNHDYWWSTAAKAYRFFEENGFDSLDILHNNAWIYGDFALCGTRGWFYEEESGTDHDRKMMLRELIHGRGCPLAFNGWFGCTEFRLVSADHLRFEPIEVLLPG